MQMLKDFQPRLYQETILATTARYNTLVVLPTGMGKTAIAVMLAIHRLQQYPDSKVVFLAPTRPLVTQHKTTFSQLTSFPEEAYTVFTGFVPPEMRKQRWKEAKIIFSTPQGFENDVINKNVTLDDVSLMIFDEAHRAVGEYSYGFIAKQYVKQAQYPRILALTASPGDDTVTISEVVKNLGLEKIEVRTSTDHDMREYIQEVQITPIKVVLPPLFLQIKHYLDACFNTKITELRERNMLKDKYPSKTALLGLQNELYARLAQGEKDFDMLRAVSIAADAMKVSHALELAETQGIPPLVDYMHKLDEQARTTSVKAVQNLIKDVNFRSAKALAEKAFDDGVQHPKMPALMNIVEQEILRDEQAKIIIFSQYRDQGDAIEKMLTEAKVSCKIFVGQQKKSNTKGMTQKEQKRVLDAFREGAFSCLIATSVAEEGLDIPKVDAVILYEPVPSAIRTVQRRGRTGRLEKGKVFVLIAKGTRDEASTFSAAAKERRMYGILKSMKDHNTIAPLEEKPAIPDDQATLEAFQKAKIITDYREKGSLLMKELMELGCDIELKRLDVGDYLLSERVCCEIKKVPDFVDSILDGRLLSQLRDLRQYPRAFLIVEGEENIYAMRNVHPNAIRGMLATIAIQYNIPIIQTKNAKDTAGILFIIARQEQVPTASYQYHTAKPFSLKEQQEYVIASLPGIGNLLAKPLLTHFGSIKNIITASEKDLQDVDLNGPIKAKRIKEIVDRTYSDKTNTI
jgi:Fanconi anemia group M protein